MRARSPLRSAALGAALAATLATALGAAAGCATVRGRTTGPTVPVDVEVRNNLPLPTDITVYAVNEIGNRTLLGGVPPNKTVTLRFKPASFTEPYRLLARRALGRDIRSQSFSVLSDMTGRIIWTLVPNIVGFEDVDTDSTTYSTAHSTAHSTTHSTAGSAPQAQQTQRSPRTRAGLLH
jgi:hypothetical protein